MEVGGIHEAALAANEVEAAMDANKSVGVGTKQVFADVFRTVSSSADDDGATEHVAVVRKSPYSPWFTIFCAGFALISDGYQNNLFTMANPLFAQLYGKAYTAGIKTRVSNALLVGAIIGQLGVGWVCDRYGRKFALVLTTVTIVVGAVLATASSGGTLEKMMWMMTIARGLTGIGVGGEYPASSVSAMEVANERMQKNRGPIFILCTNLVLSAGGPLAITVFLIVITAAGDREDHLHYVWRICFAIGILFPLAVFYFRLRMVTSKLYREGAMQRRVPYMLIVRRYWRSLIGTAGAWFLYDFVTFPNGIFSGTIISSVVKDSDLKRTAEWQLLLGILALPGVFGGAYLCNKIGRRNTMMLGFSGYLIFGLIIGLSYDRITKIVPLFVIFYGLMQSSGNLGPGDCLGLVSVESYPTAIRGTAYGLSAAIGKAGAAIGTETFTPIQDSLGKRYTFIIAAAIGVLGVLVTFFFVPDMTGKDLVDEDRKFMVYLRENGYVHEVGLRDELKDKPYEEHVEVSETKK